MYQELKKYNGFQNLPEAVYFYTSRRASSISAIENMSDIYFLLDNVCWNVNLTLRQIIERGFGIKCGRKDEALDIHLSQWTVEEAYKYIIEKCGNEILENALKERCHYLEYIKTLHLNDEKIGIMNFVGRGITQRGIQRIMHQEMKGFYLALENDVDEILKEGNTMAWFPEQITEHTSRYHLAINQLYGEIFFQLRMEH